MSDKQRIKKILLPAIKGLPLLAACLVIALIVASRVIYYATPRYESTALLKLDEKNNGVSDNNLYKDFDVFSANNKIATEERVIQSPVLLKKALRNLNFGTSYYRVGDIRKTELYKSTPFFVSCLLKDSSLLDKNIKVKVLSDSTFHLQVASKNVNLDTTGKFGELVITSAATFTLKRNDSLIATTPNYNLEDDYEFVIHSEEAMIASVIGDRLDVKAVDKDIPVLRISFSSEVPAKAADFSNALATAYINDYVESKSEAAAKTVQFIDDRLDKIGKELRESELRLEEYRLKNKIINTSQETETGLRQLSQLKVQQTNLDMEEAALNQLDDYVRTKKDFSDAGPAFDAISDPLFTEMVKNLKSYQQERRELLTRYTQDNDKVKLVDGKINDVVRYTQEAIRNARLSINMKRKELDATVQEADHEFDNLPTKEKNMIVLERNFQLNQKVYQFLLEKRTEASIAEAATISFHRIIQYASVPTTPVYPRRGFLLILAGFTGLLGGLAFIYLRRYVRGKIEDKDTIEKYTTSPVAGVIRQFEGKAGDVAASGFSNLSTSLHLQGLVKEKQFITVTSTIQGEGKSFIAENLAKALAQSGWSVALCDLNLLGSAMHTSFSVKIVPGMSDYLKGDASIEDILQPSGEKNLWVAGTGKPISDSARLFSDPRLKEKMDLFFNHVDIVIFDTPATALAIDSIALMKISGLNLYVVRSEFTPVHMLTYSDMLKEEYAIGHVRIVLNGLHRATNYNGDFTGSQFSYSQKATGISGRFVHYFKHYVR